MNTLSKQLSFFLIFLLFSFLPIQNVQAATLRVTNTNDSGAGSLRQAIADASSGDTITFDASLSGGTITLASTLDLTKNVSIDGSALASPISISGNSAVRVFYIDFGVAVTLDNLIIESGARTTGAGILNSGTLEVNNSSFSGNSANSGGSIYNNSSGNLTVNNSTFSGNSATSSGGGIFNQGTLTVDNSTLSGNSATNYGGGIYTESTLEVNNSTFSGNSANSGGGILNLSTLTVNNSTFSGNSVNNGGGIFNQGTLTVDNSTISGNSASFIGGGIFNSDTLEVNNSTFSGNSATNYGGGIYNSSFGLLGFKNTIVANSPSGLDCYNDSGSVDPGNTNNLVETHSGCGTPSNATDPLLGPLANNGGPTQTMALLPGSPAINSGIIVTGLDTDQRDVSRPQGIAWDIGAYEYDQVPILNAIQRDTPTAEITNADSLIFLVQFNEPVQNVDNSDFMVNSSPVTSAIVSNVTQNSTSKYLITVSNGDLAGFNGIIGLDLSGTQNITNLAGIGLPSGESDTDLVFTIDNTQPTVTINQAATQSDPTSSSPVHFTVEFNESIVPSTFDNTDINIAGTSPTGSVNVTQTGTASYNVEVEVFGNGTVVASIPANAAEDDAGNSTSASTSTDNQVTLSGYLTYDFGDAPDTYATTVGSNGAVHLLGSTIYLGTCVDSELDGVPSTSADGDDDNAGYTIYGTCSTAGDEDGVAFTNALVPGENATIDITANAPCNLSAWIDFDGNGFWAGTGEKIFSDQFLLAGVNRLNFSVPAAASLGNTFARFRCTTENGVSLTGFASDGEVEDYLVSIVVPTPEIDIQRLAGTSIADSGTDIISPSFGTITLTYTIDNLNGSEVLNVSDIIASNFTNVSNFVPGSATAFSVPAHGSATFEFSITIDTPNSFRFDLDFINDDSDEANYDITVSGTTLDLLVVDGEGTSPMDGTELTVSPNTLRVQFNKEVLTGGGFGAADYTGNYVLVEEGVNESFDTISCFGGVAFDDMNIIIDSVNYDNTAHTATLNINSGIQLPDGRYRLFVCGTTSIEDLYGIELNNGIADTQISFIVNPVIPSAIVLPNTGFPMGQTTFLSEQPAAKAYTASGMILEFPKMNQKISIVGVPRSQESWDVSWLGSRAGWLDGSAYPTWAGNTVLTGHVWDADNKPGVFADLKSLAYGDQFTIHAWGQTYTYEVRQNMLVTAGNTQTVMQHEELDWITLVTCESYNPNAQTYPFRRMVRGVLVKVE